LKRFLFVVFTILFFFPAFAENETTLIGRVNVITVAGCPDVVIFKTDFAEFTLLPGEKLHELLSTSHLLDRPLSITGKMNVSADGKTATMLLLRFAEYVAPIQEEPPDVLNATASSSF
jgi:hypothetical protein